MNRQKVLYSFLFLNVTLFVMNITVGTWQNWSINDNKMVTLTLLDAPANPPNLRGSSSQGPIDHNATDLVHPFELLTKKLGQFDWDPLRIDEFIRRYWNTEKSFLRYEVDKDKKIRTILTTSCLHTAAWIVTGLLELQTRPNIYRGVYILPENKDLIVYNNTQKPPSTHTPAVTQSIRKFVASRPANDSILLQFDMYLIRSNPNSPYIDHHFCIHIYNGQVNLYQGWQDTFNLLQWMEEPAAFKMRYPMPLDTFLTRFERALTYTTDDTENRKRLEAAWEVFGVTETFVYGRKELLDPIVRWLRYPWTVALITHWPSPKESDGFLSLPKM